MRIAMLCLVMAYALSQFFRAFLAVLTPNLSADLGASPEDLAAASGFWFLSFAALQIPVGIALDRFGPRRTAAYLFGLGAAGGAAIFASASAPWHLSLAMALIGAGCAPVLMAAYFIFARVYSAAAFATLAGVMLGVGCLGNIASSWPLAWSLGFMGWRVTVAGLALLSLLAALGIWRFVQDPQPVAQNQKGAFVEILKIRALWPIAVLLFVTYAPVAGLGGLWIGPYARDLFGLDASGIGLAGLVIGVALAAGCIGYGPLDKALGRRRDLLLFGSVVSVVALFALWLTSGQSLWLTVALIAVLSLSGANFPVLMAEGRRLLPPHLVGRGSAMLNLCSIGGVGLLQSATGGIFSAYSSVPDEGYRAIFLFFAIVMTAGLLAYAVGGRKAA